jgi:hypothetical protein
MPTRKNQRKVKLNFKKTQRKIGKRRQGKSKKGKGKSSSRVRKTHRRRHQAGSGSGDDSGWTGKRLGELKDAVKKTTASITADISDPIEQDKEMFGIINIPESIKRFNAYLKLKKRGKRYTLVSAELTKCHKNLRGEFSAPACLNLKFRTKVGPYNSELDRQIGPLNDFKDGDDKFNLPFIVLFNIMQIRPDGFDSRTLNQQYHDGVPEEQIVQASYITDNEFPREPVDAKRFLAQKEESFEKRKQIATDLRVKEEREEKARQKAQQAREKAEKEEMEKEKIRLAKLQAEFEAERRAEAAAQAKAEADAKAEAEIRMATQAKAEAEAKREDEFMKTAKKVGRFGVGQYK